MIGGFTKNNQLLSLFGILTFITTAREIIFHAQFHVSYKIIFMSKLKQK